MLDRCVPTLLCGTEVPGWLSGGHPTVAQGIVSRKVCFHWSQDCCHLSRIVKVRNCGAFYVYELTSSPDCNLRYCGDPTQGKMFTRVNLSKTIPTTREG